MTERRASRSRLPDRGTKILVSAKPLAADAKVREATMPLAFDLAAAANSSEHLEMAGCVDLRVLQTLRDVCREADLDGARVLVEEEIEPTDGVTFEVFSQKAPVLAVLSE
jgi:hypothetical protein